MSYRLLTLLLWPVFLGYTIKIAMRDKSFRYLFQRMGFGCPRATQKTLWIHCASVGEVNTYIPLHRKLLEKFPERQFVITTNTTTGAATVARHNPERTQHCYLPIESASAIKRFLKTCNVQQCLIMETEIWPLLYRICKQRNIPISIINARLSHRTLNASGWIKSLYHDSLQNVSQILCKSETEYENFKQLGATESQLSVAGNLKFAEQGAQQSTVSIELERAYCVAASTHHDEELQLANIWQQLDTDHLLVIIPRHPNRSEQIQQQFKAQQIAYAVRSKHEPITPDTRIYLADTLGELTGFMTNAEFVFIGGSLIPHGGQNILEAARLGKATLCGPHMFNFSDEVHLLKQHDGCLQVNDTAELRKAFQQLLDDPKLGRQIGGQALQAFNQVSDVASTYLKTLKTCPEFGSSSSTSSQ